MNHHEETKRAKEKMETELEIMRKTDFLFDLVVPFIAVMLVFILYFYFYK